MRTIIFPSRQGIENEALVSARHAVANSKSISRVLAWKTRIIDAVSKDANTFSNATLQLQGVLSGMESQAQQLTKLNEAGHSESTIQTALSEERKFADFRPDGETSTIKELIEKVLSMRQITFSETATGLSKSYIKQVLKNPGQAATDLEIHTLLKELANERGDSVQESRLEIIDQSAMLISKLEQTPLKNWAEVVSSDEFLGTAINLIEKNARAIQASIINNPNPNIGASLSLGHQPILVENILDTSGSPTNKASKPLQELQLAALLSYIVRQHLEGSGQADMVTALEQEGVPLLNAKEIKNMSLHNIDFENNPDLVVFTFATSYLLGLDPGLGDCRVCDLIKPIAKLPSDLPKFQRLVSNHGLQENIGRLLNGSTESLDQRLARTQARLASSSL